METTAMTSEVLNDLIQINNDRIEGYQKALRELKDEDGDLRDLFISMIDESHNCKMELATEVAANKTDIATGTTGSGKVYRVWMDLKSTFTGHDRHSILAECEGGEDAAQKAYASALEEEHLPAYIRTLVSDQKDLLKTSHDAIKALRDDKYESAK